ncbi:phenazine biosynthesis protein PhzF [Vibrio galatheae]|uniref:Phenazine biosynthesis protein PhzF n=1 Tax=Vibrio galatheae TaxID=579748 RepID=A0A0F4NLA3_9VIBR|nr:PhzF family phenazine biosynthesis protein [Vibrio galatheae]KJY82821.1 phenazine biosynthesis protein PhzF [Vibrio galatheae]
MNVEIYQVDSFASGPFRGNPAGVCITEHPLPEETMFAIAGEMAVSETAFLTLSDMRLRWFTPKIEVVLCGHGTLAVAHILKQKGKVEDGDCITFNTLSGPLTAQFKGNLIELDFPVAKLIASETADPTLIEALGLKSEQILSVALFDTKVLISVCSAEVVNKLSPNFDAMKRLEGRGVVVTALSDNSNVDFVSRYFAPWVGVNEDPVTGSAHCALAVYWQKVLGKNQFHAYQASARGGHISIQIDGERVKLSGTAHTVICGQMHL